MSTCPLISILAATSLVATAGGQQIVFDDFNRPDSTSLGADWNEGNGDLVISGNRCKGNVPFANDTWMNHTSFGATYTSAKARIEFERDPADSFFGAGVVIGLDPGSWGGIAVLIQDNDLDGQFDRIFFHAAINAGAWFSQPTPIFYDLPTPITAGQLTVWAQEGGDLAVARVEDASGNLIGTYTAKGIVGTPYAPTGSDVGVWVRSRPFVDDFYGIEHQALDAYPQTISVAGGGEQTIDITLESAHGGEFYILVSSQTTASPGTPIGGGVLLPLVIDPVLLWTLTHPNTPPYHDTFGPLDAIGHARAGIELPPGSSPTLVGLTLHHAAVSLSGSLVPTAVTNTASLSLLP